MEEHLRSTNRLGPIPHLKDILALKDQLDDHETHLYLTDFRSLYVSHLGDITADDLAGMHGELEHLPAYSHDRPADVYFQNTYSSGGDRRDLSRADAGVSGRGFGYSGREGADAGALHAPRRCNRIRWSVIRRSELRSTAFRWPAAQQTVRP